MQKPLGADPFGVTIAPAGPRRHRAMDAEAGGATRLA
jgi:hypothetical protein